ncbi:MAG: hypothetical protein EAX91_01930 [Candidatus Lokiarchaeota archaeon]|nr:hypothetical protein [Candidatus Lokiarchaeota archaeon]
MNIVYSKHRTKNLNKKHSISNLVTKMSNPTKEDAALLLQLMSYFAANEKNSLASDWVYEKFSEKSYDDFKTKYPPGSEGYKNVMRVASNGELIGMLVNKDLLSEDLVFDLMGALLWEKLGPIVHGIRKDANMSRLFENYEVCAKKYQAWADQNPPKV